MPQILSDAGLDPLTANIAIQDMSSVKLGQDIFLSLITIVGLGLLLLFFMKLAEG